MIERITLKNFKSLGNVDLELKNLNVLIGPNASGKSNLLSFFRLLKEGANERLSMAVNRMGGISNLINYQTDSYNKRFGWQITISTLNSQYEYTGRISQKGQSGYQVLSETIQGKSLEQKNGYFPYFFSSGQGGEGIKEQQGSENQRSFDEDLSDQELIISQIRDRIRYPHLANIRTTLADWQIYHGFGESALETIRGPQLFTVVDPFRLDPLGRNLLSIVQQLANERRYEKINERLNDTMRAVFPDFIKLYTPTSAGGMGSLFYGSENHEESIPALNMSDGQLRFLGLVIVLLLADLPNPPSLIVIDEPEIGMHPKMVEVFAELLQSASEKTQIIVTTHSPQLVDRVKPEDVVTVTMHEGKTTLERLSKPNLSEWLEHYTLGKLWTMGALGQ